MNIILGLDVSTQCIGVTLAMETEGKIDILQVTHFKLKTPPKIKGAESLFYKSAYFQNILETYKDLRRFGVDSKVTQVVIEEPLISSNNSETAGTLMRFNGMISQSVYMTLGVIPDFISSYNARKFTFPELLSVRKYNKKGDIYPLNRIRKSFKNNELVLFGAYDWGCDKKLILWNRISEIFPDIKWVYNKKQELKKENFDASDSLICVIGWVRMNLYQEKIEPRIIEYTESKQDSKTIFNYKIQFCNTVFYKKLEIF